MTNNIPLGGRIPGRTEALKTTWLPVLAILASHRHLFNSWRYPDLQNLAQYSDVSSLHHGLNGLIDTLSQGWSARPSRCDGPPEHGSSHHFPALLLLGRCRLEKTRRAVSRQLPSAVSIRNCPSEAPTNRMNVPPLGAGPHGWVQDLPHPCSRWLRHLRPDGSRGSGRLVALLRSSFDQADLFRRRPGVLPCRPTSMSVPNERLRRGGGRDTERHRQFTSSPGLVYRRLLGTLFSWSASVRKCTRASLTLFTPFFVSLFFSR